MADIGTVDIGSSKGLRFSIQIPGLSGFSVALNRFGEGLSDFSDFWETKFKLFWYATEQLHYATAGASTGAYWPPLSDAYRRWKNAHFPNATILVRSGALKASLLDANAAGAVWRSTATSLEVGSTVRYGIYHQFGTRKMPARPPMRLSDADRVRVGKLLQEFAADTWKQRRSAEAGAA